MLGLDSSFCGGVMDLSGKTILVVMGDHAWLVCPRLKQAGACVLLVDTIAGARQMLDGGGKRIDALVVAPRVRDGFSGPLIREARSRAHPCAVLVCVTDRASEALLLAAMLAEGPWDVIELPQESSRLLRAIQGTVGRTEALDRLARLGVIIADHVASEQDVGALVARRDLDLRLVKAVQALAVPELVTEEELEMLRELAAGHGPAAIASRTGKSPETVRSQLRSVRHKTRTQSLAGLLAAVFSRAFCDTPAGVEPPASPRAPRT